MKKALLIILFVFFVSTTSASVFHGICWSTFTSQVTPPKDYHCSRAQATQFSSGEKFYSDCYNPTEETFPLSQSVVLGSGDYVAGFTSDYSRSTFYVQFHFNGFGVSIVAGCSYLPDDGNLLADDEQLYLLRNNTLFALELGTTSPFLEKCQLTPVSEKLFDNCWATSPIQYKNKQVYYSLESRELAVIDLKSKSMQGFPQPDVITESDGLRNIEFIPGDSGFLMYCEFPEHPGWESSIYNLYKVDVNEAANITTAVFLRNFTVEEKFYMLSTVAVSTYDTNYIYYHYDTKGMVTAIAIDEATGEFATLEEKDIGDVKWPNSPRSALKFADIW